jgi:hypothetical protein
VGDSSDKASCAERGDTAIRRRAGSALLLVVVSLVSQGCLGDLISPALSRVVYAFTSPLPDTIVNVGDTSRVLPCALTADGRDMACRLEVAEANGGRNLTYRQGRIVMDSLGAAVVTMRPVNAQLPNDTIVRTATVRGVAPRIGLANAGTEDTLIAEGQELLLIPLVTTLSGRIIMGAPVRWTQDAGAGVAELVTTRPGWIRALGNGVAVFRASTDTASVTRRVLVRLLPYP